MGPLLLALALAAADPPRTVRAGAHFEVVCHFEAGALAVQALEAAEAAWPLAVERYGARREALDAPLELHLYRDPRAYRAAEARITAGTYRRNLAFAHHETRTAHVAVQPALDDRQLARLGLPDQTLRLIAHEAAHLARFETLANHAWHPKWYVDGGASWIDQEAMRALGRGDDLERDPWTSEELVRVQRMARAGTLPAARAVLRDALQRVGFYERYALRHLFFRYLREQRGEELLAGLERAVQRTPGGRRYNERLDDAVDRAVGEDGYARLDRGFRAWLAQARPAWDPVYRSLAPRGEDWVQLGFAEHDAVAWRTERAGAAAWTLRVELELVEGVAHLLFARAAQVHARVALAADGTLTVELLEHGRPALALATAQHDRSLSGRSVALALRVEDARLELDLDGRRALALELPETIDLAGSVGFGATRGSAVVWRGLALERR